MKNLFIVSLFLVACGPGVVSDDAGVVMTQDAQQPDAQRPDIQQPDTIPSDIMPNLKPIKAHELICSPPGTYEFHSTIYENTCSEDIVPYTSWDSTKDVPSYDCGIYYFDGWSYHKNVPDLVINCDYYMYMEPDSVALDTKCKVYKDFVEEVCQFSYSTPPTKPNY